MTGLIRLLIYLFFLLFPIGLLIRIRVADNIFVTPIEIVIILLFFLLLLKPKLYKKHLLSNKFIKYQALFLLVGSVSLLINFFVYKDINLLSSFLYLVRYLAVVSLILVGEIYAEKIKVKSFVIFSGAAFVLLGFLQYLLIYDLRPYTFLGWDDHLYRLVSTFIDPNYSGIFYAVFLIFLLYSASRNLLKESLFEIFMLFFSGIAVFATYSRTALVALIAGLSSILIIKKKVKYIFLIFISASALLFLFSDINIEGLNPFRTVSVSNRLVNMQEALEIASRSPLYGSGFNAYRDAQVRYGYRSPEGALRSNADAGTDNSFIFVIATTGLLGGAFFTLSYVFLLKKLFREKGVGIALFSMFICVMVGSIFVNALFYVPIISWLFLVAGFRKHLN